MDIHVGFGVFNFSELQIPVSHQSSFRCHVEQRVDLHCVLARAERSVILERPCFTQMAPVLGMDEGTDCNFFGVCFFWGNSLFDLDPLVHAWLGMIGVVLMLHFGGFQCLSCMWRSLGFCAPPLMNQPLRSSSLAEFWGRRWNTAFRDFANEFFFKPLSRSLSPHAAMTIAFVFSGVVHDLVISLPARGGYGLPTLFFLIQAAGMSIERSRWGRALGLMRGWRGWCFTAFVLALPAPLLFHDPFLNRIILPMMQDLGALP